jgi:hypothetical protein
MGPYFPGQSKYLTKHMQLVLIRLAPNSFMPSWPEKTSSSLVQMCLMLLPCLNRVFTSGQTGPSMTGGYITNHELGHTPTVHKPCLYSGTITGNQIIFNHQVDDLIVAPDEKTADILLNLIDDQLSIPLKRQGCLDMFMTSPKHPTTSKSPSTHTLINSAKSILQLGLTKFP